MGGNGLRSVRKKAVCAVAQSWLAERVWYEVVETDQVRAGDQEQDSDRCEPGCGDGHLHT